MGLTRFKSGQKASITRKITKKDVDLFAKSSGDKNPLHSNEKYCKKTIFQKPIVPGALILALVAAALSSKLPGAAYACTKQRSNFLRPAFVGEKIKSEVKVVWQSKNLKKVKLSAVCKNSNNQKLAEGMFSGFWVEEE